MIVSASFKINIMHIIIITIPAMFIPIPGRMEFNAVAKRESTINGANKASATEKMLKFPME